MRLRMVGIDFHSAGMETREAFSLSGGRLRNALCAMRDAGADGCAVLSTCNRTEAYFSCSESEDESGESAFDAVAVLCRAVGADADSCRGYFAARRGADALLHLMRVAGGMRSSVLGDDQIITQVRSAIDAAREAGTANPLLEAAFRAAVTAGKKIKTRVTFAREGGSVAAEAVRAVVEHFGNGDGNDRHARALVIGNGVIGRLTAEGLRDAGFSVSVTLRRHRAEQPNRPDRPAVPEGCAAVGYDDRYRAMAESDAVVSATASPHHTVNASALAELARLPELFVDLAVPRDIDPAAGDLPGVTLRNVDDLRVQSVGGQTEQFAAAEAIVAEEAERFEVWRTNRRHRTRRINIEGGTDGAGTPADFPLFINLRGATVLVAGGGKVAARRVAALLGFGASVRLASPELSPELRKMLGRDGLEWLPCEYRSEHLGGATLAIAATDSREANRRIGLDARARGILVSVADRREECSFYFPAIIKSKSGVLTAGLVSGNGDHALVKRAAAMLRREMENFEQSENGDAGESGNRA